MVDRTEFLLQKLCETLERNHQIGSSVDFNRLAGYFEHAVKVRFLNDSVTIADAARRLGLNRTTLVEYFKKHGDTPSQYLKQLKAIKIDE